MGLNRASYYFQNIQKNLFISKYHLNNVYHCPSLQSIDVVFLFNNTKKKSKYYLTTMSALLYLITGQYPKFIKSEKRTIIGCRVTLRHSMLALFVEKLNTVIFPYVKLNKLVVPRFINSSTFLLCFKTLNLFFESDFIYKNFTKYLLRFNQHVNCFIYFKFNKKLNILEKRNVLTLNQICTS